MLKKTLTVIEDPDQPGQLLLDLGLELCAELGWKVGDQIQWIDNKDGTWTIQNKNLMFQTSAST